MSERGGGERGGSGREKESVSNLVFYAHSTSNIRGVKREREEEEEEGHFVAPYMFRSITVNYSQFSLCCCYRCLP